METKTTSPKMYSLVVLYDMHTEYFPKALEGISEQDALNRLGTKANHVAWLAGSMLYERYAMAKQFGGKDIKPLDAQTEELFKDHKGIQNDVKYPSLESYKKDWEAITPVLRDVLVSISDEKLEETFEMEGMKMKNYDMASFMAYREANIIGQIILWRRLLGYEPMKYM